MAAIRTIQEDINHAGGVEVCVAALLSHPASDAVQSRALWALGVLAASPESQGRAVRTDTRN